MTTAHMSDTKSLQKENAELRGKVVSLEEQLAWLKRQIFGKKSERVVQDLNQEQLKFEGFNDTPSKEETQTIPAHERKKRQSTGADAIQLPSDLPVETIVLDVSEEDKICKTTGVALKKIGEDIAYKLAYRPGSYYLKEIIRPKYAHPTQEEKGIFTASMPDSIIPKCRADESLLAEIATRKFVDHLPLYRIAENLSRDGIVIGRRLLSQWIIKLGAALRPLYEEMQKRILGSGCIYIDETPVDLLDSPKTKQGYMWVVVGGRGSDPPYRFYDFYEDRKHEHVQEILGTYQGIIHSDKYGAYEAYIRRHNNVWAPCWAHIRRKFFEAEMGDPTLREWILEQIRQLFALEETAWALSVEERLHIRQTQEVPLIDAMIERVKKRLTEGKILPKSKFKEALGYFCSLIPYLKNYTQHDFARLDNNPAERAIRPLAIGRKNWLFFGSKEGGQSAAVLLSLVQTCRGLKINPREYLDNVFRRLMGHNSQKLHELLPDEWLREKSSIK